MANITLPSNPVNGQKVVIGTRLFQYDSTAGRWKSRVFQPLGDTSIEVTNETPTITASLSEIALDTSGANVSFTYTVSDVDSSILKVSHSVSGIANSDLATVTHHRANNTVTITAGTEAFEGGQITLTVTDGRNNATDTVDVSASYAVNWTVDLSNITYDNKSFDGGQAFPTGFTFNNDGTKLYIVGLTDTDVRQYSLSTPFDISTASYDNINFIISSQVSSPNDIQFKPDGTKMYVAGYTNDGIFQYSLSTPFDISTASYDNKNANIGTQQDDITSFVFNNDGTKFFITGFDPYNIHEYVLNTSWDISTSSYNNVSFNAGISDAPSGLAFNPEGTKLYLSSRGTNDRIHQYTLTTPFDLTTISKDVAAFSASGQEGNPSEIEFNNDGTKMYVLGYSTDDIHQYSTGL